MKEIQEKSGHEKLLYHANKISGSNIPNGEWVAQQYIEIFNFIDQKDRNSEGI